MTADDLTRLRAVAEAATPGPWEADGFYVRVGHEFAIALANSRPDTSPHDAEFIATFDPPTVAALIDRVERAERERDEAKRRALVEAATHWKLEWPLHPLKPSHAEYIENWLRARGTSSGRDEGADDGQ